MAIPRAAILLSLSMIALIFISTLVVGYSAWKFLDMNQDAFDATDRSLIQDPESERWYWEAILLYDTCDPRQDDWSWPEALSEQDDLFLLPEKCAVIGSTKEGDRASLAIHNRGSQPLDLSSRLSGARSYLGREVSRILRSLT